LVRIAIISPIFNDWVSFQQLVADLGAALQDLDCSVEIVAVDDCSSERAPDDIPLNSPVNQIRILTLASNVGHQRAIAVGLSSIVDRSDIDLVAVMDSDGEDQPVELKRLITMAMAQREVVVVGQRSKRAEGILFRLYYRAYKVLFWLLTGRTIDFGNFCVLPFEYACAISSRPEMWNHFAATVVRAGLPLKKLSTVRGTRYAGQPKMNFVNLIVLGLGAISVFSEFVFTRILLASLVVLIASALSMLIVIGIRIFTDLAIPGWTTNMFGFLLLIGIQAAMVPLSMAFILLNGRAALPASPKDFASRLIGKSRLIQRATPVNEVVLDSRA
jgi:polyisoprenyl-phosphate glycosyltransferase